MTPKVTFMKFMLMWQVFVYSCYTDFDENITTGLTATTKSLMELLSRNF